MSNIEKLETAFTKSLGLPKGTAFPGLAYGTTAGWDSMAHMQLVTAIETEFDVMLETDDIVAMSTFPIAMSLLMKYGVRFEP